MRRPRRSGMAPALAGVLVALGVMVLPGAPAARASTTTSTAAPGSAPTLTGAVDWNDLHQEIAGFGASGAFGQAASLEAMPEPQRSQVLDLLYSTSSGAGLSMVRNEVPEYFEPVPGYYDYTQGLDQVWLMQEAAKRGATRFFSTVWSPPEWMKENLSVDNGGTVNPAMYPAYADYLANYVKGYESHFGLDIYAISLANEPVGSEPYPSSDWTGQQFHDFIRYFLEPDFQIEGVHAKVIIPEDPCFDESLALPTLQDPAAAAGVGIVAGHGYCSDVDPEPFTVAQAAGKQTWETEDSEIGGPEEPGIQDGLYWAQVVDNFLTHAGVNSWSYWWAITTGTDGEALINIHAPDGTYTVNKRLFTIGNFSRFVRPGWYRMGASISFAPGGVPLGAFGGEISPGEPGVTTSAYRDPQTGRFAVVVINATESDEPLHLRLNGFRAPLVTPYVTSATQNLAAQPAISTSGGDLDATVPAQSVTTFVGSGTQVSPFDLTTSDLVASAGQTVRLSATVTNAGTAPAAGRLQVRAADPLHVAPARQDFPALPPGASTTLSTDVTVPAGTAPGDYPVVVAAPAGVGDRSAVEATSTVRVLGSQVYFTPNTAGEQAWLYDPEDSLLDGALSGGGNARFCDGNAYAIYRFQVPTDVTGGTVSLDMGNQYLVQASTDGSTWQTVLEETTQVHDLSNLGWKSLDINYLRDGGQVFYLKIGDSFPSEGWGAWLAHVKLDLMG